MPFDANDPETKAALEAAVNDAVEAATKKAAADAAALAANNKKLLDQLREARKDAQIDPVLHAKLEDRVSELEGLLEVANKGMTKAAKEAQAKIDALTKQYESEAGFTAQLLVDNGLSESLVKAGVEPHFLPAVKAMLKPQVQIVADGTTRVAKVGDKALAEFVTTWAGSDEGKFYVKAPVNGGAGAGGGAGQDGKITIQATDKAAFGANLAEIAKGAQGKVQLA